MGWSQLALEMEHAAAMGNSCRLFRLIRSAEKEALGASETICEVDGLSIRNLRRCLLRCTKYFRAKFSMPSASVPPAAIPASIRCFVTTRLPTKVEISSEIRALGFHKAPVSDDLSQTLFKDGRMDLVRELQGLFSKMVSHSTIA